MNDRLEFATEAEAQAMAEKLHANMITEDREYAKSVAAGHTTAWAIPYQETDADGNPIAKSLWYVNVKDRGRIAVESTDVAMLKPFSISTVTVEEVIKP